MITYKTKPAEKWELSKAGLSVHTFSMDIDKLIGRNLRRLRENRGISQDKLALMINTPATRLSAYETGREGMGKDIMMRICRALNVKPYEFYIENDTPIITDKDEMEIVKNVRKYPEAKPQMMMISKALTAQYETKSDKGKTTGIQKTRAKGRKTA